MHRFLLLIAAIGCTIFSANAQNMAARTNTFISLLSQEQRDKTILPFDNDDRYRFAYVPLNDRKGISWNELNAAQRQALTRMLSTGLSEAGVKKVKEIMQLDEVLKGLERRQADDHYRDSGKYFLTIFGEPAPNTIWGWRFEGHHVSFNFSSEKNELVAGTPAFMGANPAIVPSGPQKDKEILKDETAKGFELLQALSPQERQKAIIADRAPSEIITGMNRKAMIEHPEGIRYSELSAGAQQAMLALINLYVHRFTKLFADDMLKDIQQAGLQNLWFTWAGSTDHTPGKPWYYRIQGPTIIIEYDNSQNNANHIHTVVRDLKNDFGGDQLLQHYKSGH